VVAFEELCKFICDMRRLGQILRMLARILAALVLLAMACFCVFGFLASFEPGNGLIWKVGYGALACGFLIGAVALFLGRGKTAGEAGGGVNP
jgi:hypothetical protein